MTFADISITFHRFDTNIAKYPNCIIKKEMKILIIPVNFNSYQELKRYLSSIDIAASKSTITCIEVIVADNSTDSELFDFSSYNNIKCAQISKFDNIGYLGGAQAILNSLSDIHEYDFVAVSNVDIALDENFFLELENTSLNSDIAWVATKIDSLDENRDRNPKVLHRYSKNKLVLLRLMYKFPILFYLYTMTAYKRKKLSPSYPQMEIYAGHGSFMMFTNAFFKRHPKINYPVFLFGEELYFAEEIRKLNMKVLYVPALRVIDNEHVSTSTLKKNTYFRYNQESIKYILDNYYNE